MNKQKKTIKTCRGELYIGITLRRYSSFTYSIDSATGGLVSSQKIFTEYSFMFTDSKIITKYQ